MISKFLPLDPLKIHFKIFTNLILKYASILCIVINGLYCKFRLARLLGFHRSGHKIVLHSRGFVQFVVTNKGQSFSAINYLTTAFPIAKAIIEDIEPPLSAQTLLLAFT